MDLTKREYLWELRAKSQESADDEGLSRQWRRVYQRLADAADELDAFMGRSSVPTELNKG